MAKIFSPKIITLLLAVFLFLGIVVVRNVSAIGALPGMGEGALGDYGQALTEEGVNLEKFSLYNINFTGRGLTKLLVGYPRVEGENQPSGALYGLASLAGGMLLYRPASGVEYLADIGRNLGLIKRAYAQNETGYDLLSPVQKLWTVSRNLSYLAFVLIFIAIGFMIMLRTRIDPRTVATVQAAIPGIVVALILVTFSFAIAGLIVDLVNLATNLIANVFQNAGLVSQGGAGSIISAFQNEGANMNIFTVFQKFLTKGGEATANIVNQIVDAINFGLLDLLKGIADAFNLSDMIIGLFFGILIVMLMFRVFIMLLSALVTIIMLTIISPFQFLIAAMPGRGGAVFQWFKSMLTAGLTFPLTFALLLIAASFLGVQSEPFNTVQPLAPWKWFPVPLGILCKVENNACTGANLMSELIGIGILMFTPKVNDMIRTAFELKPPPWAGAPGEAVGGGIAALRKILPV